MRIAYVCFWNAFAHDGVVTKIAHHTGSWRSAGHEVATFCVSPSPPDGADQVLDAEVFTFGRTGERALTTSRMLRTALAWGPDVVYLRFDHFLPTPGRLLRKVPSVVEVNGILGQVRQGASLPFKAYSHLNEQVAMRSADAFVCVSYELRRRLEPIGKPIEVVGNGVDLSTRQTLPPPRGDRLRFALLTGAQTPWHGVDKVLEMARAMPDCDFTFIGVEDWHVGASPPPNVETHGLLSRADYEPLLAQCDVALGALAMDRIERYEKSSLKVPEYLAYGLPVILGYEETDFLGKDPWYLLKLPPTPDNVSSNLTHIREFAEGVRGRRVQHDEIADLVGAEVKEAQRLAFIERIAQSAAG